MARLPDDQLVYLQLRTELGRIENASLYFERDPDGGPGWTVASDDGEDDDLSYSYYLFFLSYRGLDFEAEGEFLDQDGIAHQVEGTGRAGCSVAVSMVAPVAAVVLQTIEEYEDGSCSIPDIDTGDVGAPGGVSEEYCRDLFGEGGLWMLGTT